MATRRTAQQPSEDTPASVPQATPGVVLGHQDHSFTLQAVMELQKSVGELNASVSSLKTSVESMKGKVDDLIGWKNKIVGGAAVLGLVAGVIGWFIGKASDYVTVRVPPGSSVTTSSPAANAPTQQPQPPAQVPANPGQAPTKSP